MEYEEVNVAMNCALDLMLRLPPQQARRNLRQIGTLCPQLRQDLEVAVDKPLPLAWDHHAGKHFLLCDFNREGSSHRSPWSNSYFPPLPVESTRFGAGGTTSVYPPSHLRTVELVANQVFAEYAQLYYTRAVSSVYVLELRQGFALIVLFKNSGGKGGASGFVGCWDSVHAVEVSCPDDGTGRVEYTLSSSVMLWLARCPPHTDPESVTRSPPHTDPQGATSSHVTLNLGGVLSRQRKLNCRMPCQSPVDPLVTAKAHLAVIGPLIEDVETQMCNSLRDVYFWRTKDVLSRWLRDQEPRQCGVKLTRTVSLPHQTRPSLQSLLRQPPESKCLTALPPPNSNREPPQYVYAFERSQQS